LLGFHVIDCATQDDAVAAVKDLQRASLSAVYELRPIPLYLPGPDDGFRMTRRGTSAYR
jgi:hypothetical protein